MLLRESRSALTRRSYDPAGALTITGALFLLVYAVVEAPDVGWGSLRTILLFAGSAVLLSAFALIESATARRSCRARILRSHTLVGANLVMLLFGTIAFGTPFILTLYAQQVLGYSAVEFGLGTAVFTIMAAIGSIVSQAVVLRLASRTVAATGMALLAGGALILTQVSAGGGYVDDMLFGLLVYGAGIGPVFVTATVAALAGVAEHESSSPPASSTTPPSRSAPRSASPSSRRLPSPAPRTTWRQTTERTRSSC